MCGEGDGRDSNIGSRPRTVALAEKLLSRPIFGCNSYMRLHAYRYIQMHTQVHIPGLEEPAPSLDPNKLDPGIVAALNG